MTSCIQNTITLTPCMRSLLLEGICGHIDIISYCNHFYETSLKQERQNDYTGDCPFCGGPRSFTINKETGRYICTTCGEQGDFLTLINIKNDQDLTSTLHFLTGYMEEAERWQRPYNGGAI
jgi:phage/plasmid primase-like uncharacterized protein